MKSESNRPITIEDLLRLKRAERPPAEFWSEFDRELRTKQLAALVGKRPWWQDLPKLVRAGYRFRVPLGATAVLAITFFSVRDYRVTTAGQKIDREVGDVAGASAEAQPRIETDSVRTDVAVDSQPIAREIAQPEVAPAADAVLVADVPVVHEISRMIALGGGVALSANPTTASMSGPVVESTLIAAPITNRYASRGGLLSEAKRFQSEETSSRSTVEPLQQISFPSDSRRSRLLTAMVATPSFETSARTTERAASRIAEERLYD